MKRKKIKKKIVHKDRIVSVFSIFNSGTVIVILTPGRTFLNWVVVEVNVVCVFVVMALDVKTDALCVFVVVS